MRSPLLVFGQFSMIAVLMLGGSWILPWWAWGSFAAGLLVFVAAALSLGKRNFTIMPDPRNNNELSTRGIYAYIRHPMYTAVLLCGMSVTFGAPSKWRWAALLICLLVLVFKIRYEEQQLTRLHPTYPQRMAKVARLFPGLW